MKLIRKNVKTQQQVITDNGNGKDDKDVILALKELASSGNIQAMEDSSIRQDEEKTKFTVLHDLSNTEPDKIRMHTELDKNEILVMNRIYMVTLLVPKIFGDTKNNRESIKILENHMREHRLNKMSFNRKRELDLVYAVHGADNSVPATQSAVAKVLGLKK